MMRKEITTYNIFIVLVLLFYKANSLIDRCYDSPTDIIFTTEDSQNLIRENPPKKLYDYLCADWCNDTIINPIVFDCQRGMVRLHIPPSPEKCNHTHYTISLKVKNATEEECGSGISLDSFHFHTSEKDIKITRNSSFPSEKDIKLDFYYVFTGCYRLKIKPMEHHNSHQSCYSLPFFVRTNYTIDFITTPQLSKSELSINRYGVVEIEDGGGLFSTFSVVVRFHNVSQSLITPIQCCSPDSENLRMKLENHIANTSSDLTKFTYDTNSANPISPINYTHGFSEIVNEGCECEWETVGKKYKMKCTFSNLTVGNYRVDAVASDLRCVTNTIWTDWNPDKAIQESSHPCFWSFSYTFKGTNNTGIITVKPGIYHSRWIPYVSIAVISIIVTVVAIYYFKIRPPKTNPGDYNLIGKETVQISLFQKAKILLLYPRDCQPFMEAMESFRTMLKCTGRFEVFDALDPAQEEDVAERINTWGLNLISDPSTKVILVASWCSLRFYEALLDKDRLSYIDKLPFDTLFSLHLDQLFVQQQPYKKIYVVRLDCDNSENLCFEHIVQIRNFTLPQCTESLVKLLLEFPADKSVAFEDNSEKSIARLRDSIEKYSYFVRENPNYLNSLIRDDLMIDNQTLDYNVM